MSSLAVAEQIHNIRALSSQLYEKDSVIEKEHRRLKAFNSIIVRANESTTQKDLVKGILDACIDYVNFDIGGLYLIRNNRAEIVATRFIPEESIETLNHVCIGRPELRNLFKFGRPIHVVNYDQNYPETSALLGGIKSLISVPILYNNKVGGCINIGAFNNVEITSEECDILRTLGKHLGHVLHRFEVERELELKNFDLEVHIEELRASNDSLTNMLQHLETSQQQLDLEHQNFHTLFNKMTDMIFVVSFDGTILTINDAVRIKLGYPNGNLIGQCITKVLGSNTTCNDSVIVMKDMIGDDAHHCTLQLVSSTNELIVVDSRIVHGLWDGSEVLYYVAREVV